jgi:hypothetical protein
VFVKKPAFYQLGKLILNYYFKNGGGAKIFLCFKENHRSLSLLSAEKINIYYGGGAKNLKKNLYLFTLLSHEMYRLSYTDFDMRNRIKKTANLYLYHQPRKLAVTIFKNGKGGRNLFKKTVLYKL